MAKLSPETLMFHAEELCSKRHVRLTDQRREVLRLLAENEGAISAYDLLDKLKLVEPQAKPPTIYRALDFLREQGFVHKVESSNSYVLCHDFTKHCHSSLMLICNECHKVTEIHESTVDATIRYVSDKNGFAVKDSVVEVKGVCQACQEKPSDK